MKKLLLASVLGFVAMIASAEDNVVAESFCRMQSNIIGYMVEQHQNGLSQDEVLKTTGDYVIKYYDESIAAIQKLSGTSETSEITVQIMTDLLRANMDSLAERAVNMKAEIFATPVEKTPAKRELVIAKYSDRVFQECMAENSTQGK